MGLTAPDRMMANTGEQWTTVPSLIAEGKGLWRDKRGGGASALTTRNTTETCADAKRYPPPLGTDTGAKARLVAPSPGRPAR